MRDHWVFVTLFALLAIKGSLAEEEYVSGIYPTRGSLNGGTRISVYGTGFSKNLLNLGSSENIGNKVYLVSATREYPCDIHEDGCTRSQVTCYTRPMESDRYFVRIYVDNIPFPLNAHCGHSTGQSNRCSFYAHKNWSPDIREVLTPYGFPDDLVTVYGKMFTDKFGTNVALGTNDVDAKFLRVWLTDRDCSLVHPDNADIFYGMELDSETSNYGTFTCKPQGTLVGYRNQSFIVDGQYGRSSRDLDTLKIGRDNTIYMMQTYAPITAISHQTGSEEGGTPLIITGKYFDKTFAPVKVMVGDEECTEATITSRDADHVSEITCLTPAMHVTTGNKGDRGILVESWHGDNALMTLTDWEISNNTDVPHNVSRHDEFLWVEEDEDRYITRTRTFFIAPQTGTYVFLLRSDDGSTLYVSEDGDPDNKVMAVTNENANYGNVANAGKSPEYSFTMDQRVYLEVVQTEWSGRSAVRLAVHLYDTVYNQRHSGQAYDEQSRITTDSVVKNEVQQLVLENTESASGVQEQQSFTLTCSSLDAQQFSSYQIEILNHRTVIIPADASSATVQDALSNLAFSDYTDQGAAIRDVWSVADTSGNNDLVKSFTVTFPQHKGSYGVMQVHRAPGSSNDLQITTSIGKVGESSGKYLNLQVYDSISPALAYSDMSRTKLDKAVTAMLGVRCPRYMVKPSGAQVTIDYEGSSRYEESGERTSEVPAFCGRYSSKNPSFVYSAGQFENENNEWKTGVSSNRAHIFCFAFLGLLEEQVYLLYRYNDDVYTDEQGVRSDYLDLFYYNDESNANNPDYVKEVNTDGMGWRYRCINLLQMVQDRRVSVTQIEVLEVRLYNAAENSNLDPFYIDTVAFTSKVPSPSTSISIVESANSQDINSLITDQRMIPSKWFLNEATVTNDDSIHFNISMTTHDCQHDIQLMRVAHAQVTETGTTTTSSSYAGLANSRVVVNSIEKATPPVQGKFSLNFGSYSLPNLDMYIEAHHLAGGISQLSDAAHDFGQVSVIRDGTCSGYTWTVTHTGKAGNHPNMELAGTSNIVPDSATISVDTLQDGGVIFDPIPGDMISTAHWDSPQVQVSINGMLSKCETDCSFSWTTDATPILTGVTPTSGTSGDTITLSGSGFSVTAEENDIMIGGVACDVQTASDTSITCDLGEGPAGSHSIVFIVTTKGLARHDGGPHTLEYQFTLDTISHSTGSLAGGRVLTVGGSGFSTDTVVKIGANVCDITEEITYSTIECEVPAGDSLGVVTVTAENGALPTATGPSFTYEAPVGTITAVDVTAAAIEGGTVAVITGTGFRDSGDQVLTVGGMEVEITSYSDTSIEVVWPASGKGTYPIHLKDGEDGYADNGGFQVTYALTVSNVYPTSGSAMGGSLVTITGNGFSTDLDLNEVMFGETECDVMSATTSEIVCELGFASKVHKVTNQGYNPDVGAVGYAWDPLAISIQQGEMVEFSWTTPQHIQDVGYRVIETANMSSEIHLNGGFQSGSEKVRNGKFRYQFWNTKSNPSRHYTYSSGYVDANEDIFFFGKIDLSERSTDDLMYLSVKIGEVEADYMASGGNPASGACTDNTAPGSGCHDLGNTDDLPHFNYAPRMCQTATISSISPSELKATEEIIIRGTGFSTSCSNEVYLEKDLYRIPCNVQSNTATEIRCIIDSSCNSMPVGIPLSVDVKVANLGWAAHAQEGTKVNRAVIIKPHTSGISPATGSTEGGLTTVITGGNFMFDPENTCTGGERRRKRSAASDAIQDMGGSYSYSLSIPGCSSVEIIDATTISCTIAPGTTSVDLVPTVTTLTGSFTSGCTGVGTCSFTPNSASTPQVTAVANHPITSSGQALTMTGSLFGTVSGSVVVSVGESTCTISSITDVEIICVVDEPVAGTHALAVLVLGVGLSEVASAHSQIGITGSVTSVSPDPVGLGGGLDMSLVGFGFHPDDTVVTFGGEPCVVTTVTFNEITCTNPALAAGSQQVVVTTGGHTLTSTVTYGQSETPAVDSVTPSEGVAGDTITIAGSNFGAVQGDVSVSVGSQECAISAFSDTSISCELDGSVAGPTTVQVNAAARGLALASVEGALDFTYQLELNSITPSTGSTGGGQTVALAGNGFDPEGTTATICGNPCELTVDGLLFTGFSCITPADDTGSGATCDVVVTLANGETQTLAGAYTYQTMATITGVSPRDAGTGGGKSITVTGTGFGTNPADVTVSMAGTECDITSIVDNEIICDTGAHKPAVETKVEVRMASSGIAHQGDNAAFEYIDLWSSIYTWGGDSLPVEGDLVVIPADMKVRLDVDTPVFKVLLIQGGTVVFDGMTRTLRAEIILITDGGHLQLGTEDEPYPEGSVATIELHGHVRSKDLPIYGTKVIGVREGTLDMHGQPLGQTWTLLDATANPGDTTIQVQGDLTGIKAGDELVIASTGDHFSQGENELRVIASISGQIITLTEALEHKHLGEDIAIDGTSKVLKARAEVGFLTRNVRFTGSDNTDWHDEIEACEAGFDPGEFATQTCFQGRFGEEIGSEQFGAQILIHSPEKAYNESDIVVFVKLSNVELFKVGQAFRLGRYAIHFHINGDMTGSYVRGCSIHESYNRAVNIHATNFVEVEDNVVYHVMGGAFFLEDGVEIYNAFRRNLAVFVISSTSLQNDDITPAAFWITNALNYVVDNHAAGGSHFGFWYRIHEHPDGPSFDVNYFQRRVPLLEFSGNVGHSLGWFCVWIFQVFTPMTLASPDGSGYSDTPQAAVFNQLTCWNCEKAFESVGGGAIQVQDSCFVNNEVTALEYKLIKESDPYSETGGPMVSGTTVVARLVGLDVRNAASVIAFTLPQGRGLIVKDMTYVGFNTATKCVYTVANIQGTTQEFNGGYTYHGSGHTYVDTDCIAAWRWPHDGMFIDVDGTVSGSNEAGTKILPGHNDLPNPGCDKSEVINGLKFNAGPGGGAVCDPEYEFHRFAFNHFSPPSLEGKNVSFANQHGEQLAFYCDKSTTHKMGWRALLLSDVTYHMTFVNAEQLTNLSYEGIAYDYAGDQWNVIEHPFYQIPDRVGITEDLTDRNMSENALSSADNRYGDWHIPLATVNSDGFHVYETAYLIDGEIELPYDENTTEAYPGYVDRHVHLQVYRCFYAGCVEPLPPNETPPPTNRPIDAVLWTDNTIWSYDVNGFATASKETANTAETPLPDEAAVELFIAKETWVVLNASPGHAFKEVTIYGTLEFEWALPASIKKGVSEPMTLEFECTHLFISGGRMFVGWEDKPMLNNVIISLAGNQFTPDKVIQNGPNMGAKAIGVFGGLEMHGQSSVTWTRLSTTAMSGMKEIRLDPATSLADLGWAVGDQIVIAGTGFAPGETEVHTIASFITRANGIILEDPLQYSHSGDTVLDLGNGNVLKTAAEVGRLTRNIKVQGVTSASDIGTTQDMSVSGFGGRLIVGEFSLANDAGEAEVFTGYARIKNVEFQNMGQEGWNDLYDPRYALAYLNTGEYSNVKPSTVEGCSIWDSHNTALGLIGSWGITVKENVVYGTVGSGMIIMESSQTLESNFVVLSRFPGTIKGRKEQQDIWVAGIEVNKASDIRMVGNAVADFERGGYRIDGESCDPDTPSLWSNNIAHTGMAGVFMLPDEKDGLTPCGLVSGFYVYHCFDWGMYLQTPGSLILRDNTLLENRVGTFQLIYTPSSTNHEFADKFVDVEDSYYIGATNLFDCNSLEKVFKTTAYAKLLEFSDTSRSWFINGEGMTGLSYPTFSQGPTLSPRKPMNNIMSYNSINGRMTVTNTIFYKYQSGCNGGRDYAISTSSANDDAVHPGYLEGVSTSDVDRESLFFNHRPNLGKINPSDCVDMDCDGLKKVILKDRTGDYFGTAGATAISQSEWEWGGDPRRGLGDYRIPKVLQSDLEGNRIDIADIATERGIVRNKGCELMDSYQAWLCNNMDHEMLMIESLDDDSETRRISPVAVQGPLSEDDLSHIQCTGTEDQPCFVDLLNGPQDHGWCMGYTCQKRLSLFGSVVNAGSRVRIVTTGTTPQDLRLHWLNTDDTQAILVGIWFSRPYRLDTYHGDMYVAPTNMDPNYGINDLRLLRPLTDDQWMPDVDTDVAGTNYYERSEQFLYVIVRGSTPVTIRTVDTVFVNFDIPMLTVDEFFGDEIVTNLANFFDISPDKIRVATAVRESRKKRQDTLQVIIEISNNPHNLTDVDPSDLSSEELSAIASRILETYQLGELEDVLELDILSFNMVEPPPGTDTDTWQVMAELGTSPTITALIPSTMEFDTELKSLHEGTAFSTQPVLKMRDANGDVVSSLGTIASPWEITATLYEVQSDWDQAALIGEQTVKYQDGQFEFSDLGVSHSGTYMVTFTVTSPAEATHFSLDSKEISVANRKLAAGIVTQPEMVNVGQEFNVTVEIVDAVTGEKVEDIAWKGHTWDVSASLYMPDMYQGDLSTLVDTVMVDPTTGEALFNDISISDYGRYFLAFDFMSSPNDLDFDAPADMAVDVYPQGYINPEREVLHHIKIKFDGDFEMVVLDKEMYFHAAVYNQLWYEYIDVAFSNFESTAGSILVAFDVAGTRESLDAMVDSLWEQVQDGYSLEFNGHTITATGDMWVDGENLKEEKNRMHVALIVVIVILAVTLVGTILGFILYKYCKSRAEKNFKLEKREPTSKRRKTGPVTDDYYNTVGMPDTRSNSSLSSGSHDNEEKPIVSAAPPKSTHFDFLNVRPKSSYRPPGALPPLEHRAFPATTITPTANDQDSRPVSSTYLDIALVANSPAGMPRVDTPEY